MSKHGFPALFIYGMRCLALLFWDLSLPNTFNSNLLLPGLMTNWHLHFPCLVPNPNSSNLLSQIFPYIQPKLINQHPPNIAVSWLKCERSHVLCFPLYSCSWHYWLGMTSPFLSATWILRECPGLAPISCSCVKQYPFVFQTHWPVFFTNALCPRRQTSKDHSIWALLSSGCCQKPPMRRWEVKGIGLCSSCPLPAWLSWLWFCWIPLWTQLLPGSHPRELG